MGPMGRDRVRHPSNSRIRILPEARSARRSMGTVSGRGGTVRGRLLRLSYLTVRSIASVVRADLHRDGPRAG